MGATRFKRYALLGATLTTLAFVSCAPPPAPASVSPSTPFLNAIWQETNRDRAANGLATLAYQAQLARLAADWAAHLAQTETLEHHDLAVVIADPAFTEYSALGENLLSGPVTVTPYQAEQAWMASPEHRANVLSANYNVMGAGAATSTDGRLWVVVELGGMR
jgi:uncharacterized protein YkwD